MQFLTRPFVVGEVVTLQQSGITGSIQRVSAIRTTLRTADGTLVSIPNKVGACMFDVCSPLLLCG